MSSETETRMPGPRLVHETTNPPPTDRRFGPLRIVPDTGSLVPQRQVAQRQPLLRPGLGKAFSGPRDVTAPEQLVERVEADFWGQRHR
jgi:hypothetical protein